MCSAWTWSPPLVVLAAAVSLGLALAVWQRPEWRLLLRLVVAGMVVFAALDVWEVFHQLDEDNGDLAVLAAVVTVLHRGGAAVALSVTQAPGVAARDSRTSLGDVDRKQTVRRFIDEAINGGRDELIDEMFTTDLASRIRDWFGAFRRSFPDITMETVQLVAEGDTVVGHFACSATHRGEWRGHPPTGRRFENVDEVYFFTFSGERIATAWGIEDTLGRFQQLGIDPSGP